MNFKDTCYYCDRPAIVLCDYVEPIKPRGLEEPPYPCSRALCAEHRRKVGHMCSRGRNKNLSDTIDYCKEHPQ